MAVWVIRAGRMGENEEIALNDGVYSIGFGLEQSVADFSDRDSLRNFIQETQSLNSVNRAAAYASQLWRFAYELKMDEMIVLPRKRPKVIAVGKIAGDYVFDSSGSQAPLPHIRKVEWQVQDVPRANFDQDLKHSFTSQLTVSQIRKDNAEARILQVVNAYLGDEQMTEPIPLISSPEDLDDEDVNLEETINDRILERIRQRYHRHDLETLVDEILKAEGYVTLKTEAGPDGGADILAGSGALGFDSPKLCVQVKSGASNVGIGDYDRLQGTLDTFNADYGLLVSSTGFTQAVIRENRRRFFKMRLWGPDELVQKLLDTYDRLPQSIRADIPLENRLVWLGPED